MGASIKQVHMYQKEFEVNQQAFLKAVTELHDLDRKMTALLGKREARDLDEGEAEVVDSPESDTDVAKIAERHRERNKVLEDENAYWDDTSLEGSNLSW
jgi:hypothetical protein